ncbi:siderophore-interacting protein [Leucobacter sp. W1478]|uniref:siderophore-interacting protein n=1 Tax=Leucobacter sp. W1478 TaxID=3439065 RepID=UPI003F2B6F5C
MTEVFARERTMHDLQTRRVQVLRTAAIAPKMVRITLGGEDLTGFSAVGPADHVKVFFPDPETGVLTIPEPGGFRKPRAEGAPAIILRDYTPFAFRGDAESGPELDIDFVLHGDHGVAAAWAAQAKVGDKLGIGGPRASLGVPAGVDSAILVADESALPAATRWLQAFDASVPVTGLFFVKDADTSAYLDGHNSETRELRWFTGVDRASKLEATLRALPIGERTFVFLAGEANTLIPLRRYLRRELGLSKAQADVHGYWKQGEVALDHHAPLDPTDPED